MFLNSLLEEGIIEEPFLGKLRFTVYGYQLIGGSMKPETKNIETTGLRLALLTQTGDDASLLRTDLTKRLVIESLHTTSPQSPGQLAQDISSQLHLGRSLSADYLNHILPGQRPLTFREIEP